MKKTLFIIAMLFSLIGKAQMVDSMAVVQLNERIDNINLNLDKSHKQFRTGTYLVAAGLAVNGLALIAGQNGGGGFLAGFGSLFLMAGTVVHIDSHKYIGRTRKEYPND